MLQCLFPHDDDAGPAALQGPADVGRGVDMAAGPASAFDDKEEGPGWQTSSMYPDQIKELQRRGAPPMKMRVVKEISILRTMNNYGD